MVSEVATPQSANATPIANAKQKRGACCPLLLCVPPACGQGATTLLVAALATLVVSHATQQQDWPPTSSLMICDFGLQLSDVLILLWSDVAGHGVMRSGNASLWAAANLNNDPISDLRAYYFSFSVTESPITTALTRHNLCQP